MIRYALFGTALGWAGVAWTRAGLAGCRLPDHDEAAARAGLLRRFPGSVESDPPAHLLPTVHGIQALLRGEGADLTGASLDLARTSPFRARVYGLTRMIPAGVTRTYGAIAEELGDRRLAREVGQALGRNPWPLVVPCHRVTAADGGPGGFSAPGGVDTKLRLLAIEGARRTAQGDLFAQTPGEHPQLVGKPLSLR